MNANQSATMYETVPVVSEPEQGSGIRSAEVPSQDK